MMTWWEVELELDRVRGSTSQEWCFQVVNGAGTREGYVDGFGGVVLCEGELEAERFR